MSIEDNKAIATAWFTHLNDRDVDGALALMSDDATWWLAGEAGTHHAVGWASRQQAEAVLRGMFGQLENEWRYAIKSLIAEQDRVALEVEGRGKLLNGRHYNQQYHYLFTIRNGRITTVKEYLDTHHVMSVWFTP